MPITVYDIVYDDDGNEVSRTEVPLNEVQLPDNHPVKAALKKANAEAKSRREKAKQEKTPAPSGAADGDASDDNSDEPATERGAGQRTQQPVIDVAAIQSEAAKLAAQTIRDEQAAAAAAVAAHNQSVDEIMTASGLDPALRDVISAIADPAVAKATAEVLAKRDLQFGTAPSGGNGVRDPGAVFKGVADRLGLQDDPNAKKNSGY